MDIQQLWDKARRETELIRLRLAALSSVQTTAVPYIFLAESSLHQGDTVIRRGSVLIERPAIVLPSFSPQFEGFEFELEAQPRVSGDSMATFLLLRGIQFPSLRYRHELSTLDVMESSLRQAVEQWNGQLTRAEDIHTGLVVGPEDAWQFSLLLLIGALVVRSAEGDLRRILDDWRQRRPPGSGDGR